MKSINMQGGIFVSCRVEFSKIGKRDVTFVREMRVYILCLFLKTGLKRKYLLRFYHLYRQSGRGEGGEVLDGS
jgi:hypothetical protein